MKIKASTCEWMRRISLVLSVATFIFFWVSFADVVGAKTGLKWMDLTQAGALLWIFIIVGAIIILLQLIPALILFFNFIGTGVHAGYTVVETKKEKEFDFCKEVYGKSLLEQPFEKSVEIIDKTSGFTAPGPRILYDPKNMTKTEKGKE